jgi:AcrR family transcriptional regulator
MAERGGPAVSVEAIAERSGVAKTTIYRHWPTREALLADAWTSVGYSEPLNSAAVDLDERVAQIAHAVGTRISTPPMSVLLPDLLAAAERDPKIRELKDGIMRTRRRPLTEALQEAAAAGALPSDVDVELLVALIVGPIYYRRLILQQPVTNEFVERVVAVALDTARHGLVASLP